MCRRKENIFERNDFILRIEELLNPFFHFFNAPKEYFNAARPLASQWGRGSPLPLAGESDSNPEAVAVVFLDSEVARAL